ncbi:hypothetical protein BC962_0811 [Gillisia mitskevichiae]|uniref:Lipoprotein n=1 Tax=Gillisia mitskevichiae TaxID=270921 RepID=A0A495PZ21_9FLAO|nr:hypothetical protein [Gillisia mitskevichiae]RKS55839.1 hypothetical protein BC962_0811 [Gillisia mitskevichiae]
MKKSIKSIALITSMLSALFFGSCSNDDNFFDEGDQGGTPVNPIASNLNGSISANLTLDPNVSYKLTGSLSVESGVKLTIPAGTSITANVGQEVYIVVKKGAQIDVQGTQNNPVRMSSASGSPGDWGGLVLLGDATTTEGIDATAEVGGFIYGGTDDTDDSGTIRYLIIEGAGAQINADSQYNGLTLYAIGSGTTIENIALLNGADDGVEFFGGTVSVKNLYLENNEDDAVDWTEGWSGTVTNAYVLHTIEGFSTAIEADGLNNNPKIVNFTAVSSKGGTALQFKKESGATISGLALIGYDTSIDMKDEGSIANVLIEDVIADPGKSYTDLATVDIALFNWINNRGSVEATVLQGVVEGELSLNASVAYELTSSLIVKDGGKLTIPAGTKITARDGGTDVYIAILQGGKIDIQGTPENPVVISSQNAMPGDWGGLTIVGKATTTEGINATAEVGGFIYGGSDDTDNSGSIKNLTILGTGAQINADSQYNGVSLYAVGSGTILENIAVINGSDDGIEFFGGTVSATNLYFENNEDDAVDWTEGWNGTVTNTYISHTNEGFSTALEADGLNNNPKLINFTAISTTGGTALQFKKESGATINNIYLEGYQTNLDMKDNGPVANVKVDGINASLTGTYNAGTKLDISGWSWRNARL